MSSEFKSFSCFPEVRVVEASAGSGKTYCLARRYVQLLLNPQLASEQTLLRHILAITFTNKAAYAMKGRILEFFKKIALGTMSTSEVQEILSPINLSPAQAKPLAIGIMDELIRRYNFFQVQTIDSFINTLLSGCAFKIGLSAGFKIKRQYADYLQRSFDQMIDQAFTNKAIEEILARFLQQYLFLENKIGWFPKRDMLDLLSALYSQSNTYGRDFVISSSGSITVNELHIRKKKILNLFMQLQEKLPNGTYKLFAQGLQDFLMQNKDGFDIDRLSDYFAREELPVKKGVIVTPAVDGLWQEIRVALRQLAEAEAYSLFDTYVEVFNFINRDFHIQAAKDDVLFLPELNRRARALFDDGMVSVEELYYRLATRFHHYLLDEFQDTSRLQWQNLELMIEEALSTGGTLFYVGDKKQAIYGFRGGEVKLFDEVKERFAVFNVATELLSTNYRSEKAIVEFNNIIFSVDNLKRYIHQLQEDKNEAAPISAVDIAQIEGIFQSSQQAVSAGHDGGYVSFQYVETKDKEESRDEIRLRLLNLVKSLKERFSYSQIAILTRSNTEIEELTSWLMAEGIFVESERTLNIKENPLILELVAFLTFLDSPIDNLSFAKFISGDIFSKATGLSKGEIHTFLFNQRAVTSDKKDHYLYRAFQDYYPKLWEKFIEQFFKNVGLFPLYEICASILRCLEVYPNFPDEYGFFLRFLELIKEKEEEFSDLNSFLERFACFENDELFVNVVNSDAIKILTTHKAKGLEFPVVIIPFLGMKVHSATGGGLGQQSYVVDASEEDLKLIRVKKKYLKFSQKLDEVDRIQKVRSFISELNNIYVALTRAGQELYAFIPSKMGSSKNLLIGLIPQDLLQCGAPKIYPAHHNQKQENPLGLPSTAQHDWISFLKEEFTDVNSVLRRQDVRRGTVLHDALSHIGNLYGVDKTQVIDHALAKIRVSHTEINDWKEYQDNLRRILTADLLHDFYSVQDGEVFLEKDLVNGAGQTRRIDRLIVKKEEIWIIDYKSSQENRDKYFQQVKEYMSIVREIHPQKTVKGYLLYFNTANFEEVI